MSHPNLGSETGVDLLLIKVFHAYRQGLRRQPQLYLPVPPRDFDALMFLGTIGWILPEDRLQLRHLSNSCGKGLTAARQGQLDESLRHYQQAKEYLDYLEGKTRLAWLVGVSTYQSGAAYLDFRCGCAQHACERLDIAMDADLELEQAGLPVMQMHRIQQGHNLVRMEFRRGQREVAVRLASILLAYMERQIDKLPYHRDWRPRWLQAVPRNMLQGMIHQITGEAAGYIVIGDASADEWSVLIEASCLCRDPESSVFPQVQYALRAQHDRLTKNPEGYLRNLERFFHVGIRHCHRLWYAVMVELVDFCCEVDTRYSRQVRDVILRDTAKWKDLPSPLRNYFDSQVAAQRYVA